MQLNKKGPTLAPLKSITIIATLLLLITSCSSDDEAPTPDVTPPIVENGPIAAPTGLASTVYSSSSVQIRWEAGSTAGLTYEVSRDDTVVSNTSNTSFTDNALASATTYTYGVVAIAADDRRSAMAEITLITQNSNIDPNVPGTIIPPAPNDQNIAEPANLYEDGYSPSNVIRVDLRTATVAGPCNAVDESGCTLADVMADVDKFDDHTVDINVHFKSSDFVDDGSVSNAELRLRGGGSRSAPQKSFRIKLDSKEALWRGERHLQLNKHPYESSRIRNKLAMDIMAEIPNLPSVRTQFVNLWIDDGQGPVDYGLFTHVERVNGYFLRKRGWNDDDRIYKAEYFKFNKQSLDTLKLDELGEPLNKDLFESTLSIENGDDHRPLVAMITALHDPNRTFDSVLNQYFDRSNVMAWVTANILLRQKDAVRHNYILYNPVGTEKFYFVPWDYDEAMGEWIEPPNDMSADSLRQRLEYGYALASQNTFLNKFYKQPGIHEEILTTIESIRRNHVLQDEMAKKVNHYIGLSEEYQNRAPDSLNNPGFTIYSSEKFISLFDDNELAVRSNFGLLMPPTLFEPTLVAGQWRMTWEPAYDVTSVAGVVQYRLQIATTPTFDSQSIVVDISQIQDAPDVVVQNVAQSQLPAGQYFARLIATPSNEPERLWQVSGNKLYFENQTYYGAMRFVVP